MMVGIIFFVILGVAFVVSRIIAHRFAWEYLAGGLCFGMYNEICFEFCWNYSDKLAPMIWRDVPLVVVLGWGMMTVMALVISDRVCMRYRLKNRLIKRGCDTLFFILLCVPNEIGMSKLGYWSYNFPIQGELWMQIYGYVFVSLIVSSLGRSVQMIADDRFRE